MTNPPMLRLIIATRGTAEDFFARTATGRSLAIYAQTLGNTDLRLYTENRAGLPEIYNQEIERSRSSPAALLFMHDDLHLCDFWWNHRVFEALSQFRLVGLAGNRRRVPGQPTWVHLDVSGARGDPSDLSGSVAYGKGFPPEAVTAYGPSCQEVKLLDGLFLAGMSETFLAHDIRFEERLSYHFYDLDLCRQFEAKGLSMGTWNISVVHHTKDGDFNSYASPEWRAAYETYLEKWKE